MEVRLTHRWREPDSNPRSRPALRYPLPTSKHSSCVQLRRKEPSRSARLVLRSGPLPRAGGVYDLGGLRFAALLGLAAHVGLDLHQDIRWVTSADSSVPPLELFAQGKIDAFIGTPPEPHQLRARGKGTSSSTASSIAHGRNISAAC